MSKSYINIVFPIAIVLFFSFPNLVKGQSTRKDSTFIIKTTPDTNNSNGVFTIVQMMPQFPGDVHKYISDSIHYPAAEQKAHVQGTVYVNFVVEKDGTLSNIKILRGVKGAPGFDAEALRVFKSMPKWTPGMQNGHPVRVTYTLPVRFILP